jgi:hypothetical protein
MAVRKGKLVAVASFATEVKGQERFVHAGDVVAANSPLVKGRSELFVTETEYRQTEGTPPVAG